MNILLQVADSKNFSAGGGSASALAGAMAAGMVGMVARLSLGKNYGFKDSFYLDVAEELDNISKKLLQGAESDTKAYLEIKNAYRLPKETKEDKDIRRERISDAGISAASIPRDNGYMCKKVYKFALLLDGKFNSAAYSDLQSALYLSEAGIKGCKLNIEVNLDIIKDEKAVTAFKEDIQCLTNLE